MSDTDTIEVLAANAAAEFAQQKFNQLARAARKLHTEATAERPNYYPLMDAAKAVEELLT